MEKRLGEEAPALINLAKPLQISLRKNRLEDCQAKVGLAIDSSRSMYDSYANGVVQQIINKILPLAVQFDDDGELDLWYYGTHCRSMPSVNLRNYQSAVPSRPGELHIGMGNNEPLQMREVIRNYSSSELPVYIVIISDGGIHQDKEIANLLISSSKLPIFWQFVGVGGKDYGILEHFDSLQGRVLDNCNFFALDDFRTVSNDVLYERLLQEFPLWLKEAKKLGIVKQ
ncbi:VWA domain-containing protein [bacterium]|nr:VWA domain-containing protein [bacterium]